MAPTVALTAQVNAALGLIGTATVAPHTISLANVAANSYSVAAKAAGSLGGTATSALVNLVVVSNAAPVVSLNVNAASTLAPASVTLSATASDSDGSVAKVAFYNGAALLGEVSAAPYTFVWNDVGANSYSITAVATDDRGATATSTAQPLTITAPGGPGTTNVYYVHADHINTAREITDAAGVKVWEAGSDPFGAQLPNENPSARGRFVYNQRFPGQYFDAETGLHYNYYRDYDPQTGRYVQSDPIGLGGGINTYSYVLGNPLSKVDPLGLLVTAVLDRRTGTLTVTDNDTHKTVTAVAFTGGNTYDRPWYKDIASYSQERAAPDGDYFITDNVNPNPGHPDWFALLQKKARLSDTFMDGMERRTGARLHLGGTSFGCVTVDKNTPGQEKKWKDIVDMLHNTKPGIVNYHPSYYYYDNRTTNLQSYGTLTIR